VVCGAVTRMAVAERRIEQGNLDPAAAGGAPEGDYGDPTAVLAGVWGPNLDREARPAAGPPAPRAGPAS
jgi:hypothetical protein